MAWRRRTIDLAAADDDDDVGASRRHGVEVLEAAKRRGGSVFALTSRRREEGRAPPTNHQPAYPRRVFGRRRRVEPIPRLAIDGTIAAGSVSASRPTPPVRPARDPAPFWRGGVDWPPPWPLRRSGGTVKAKSSLPFFSRPSIDERRDRAVFFSLSPGSFFDDFEFEFRVDSRY
jgi:hypothetical protein